MQLVCLLFSVCHLRFLLLWRLLCGMPVARQRKLGKQPQVDPQALMQLQTRISEQVKSKFGVTDEQVMAAVEHYNAKTDPAFKDILARIANTLNNSLA